MHFLLAFFDLITIAKYFTFNHTASHDFGGCITPEKGCVSYVREHLEFKMSCNVPDACGPYYYILSWDGDSFFGSDEVCMATKQPPVSLEEYSIAGHADIKFFVSHWKIRRAKRGGKLATAAKPLVHQCLQFKEDGYQQHALPISHLDHDNHLFQWRHFGYDQFAIPVPDENVPLLLSGTDNVDPTVLRKLVPFLIYYGKNGRIEFDFNSDKFMLYTNGIDPVAELLTTDNEVSLDNFPVRIIVARRESEARLYTPIHTSINFAAIERVAIPYTGPYQYDNTTHFECQRGGCVKRSRQVGNLLSVKAVERNMFLDLIDRLGVMLEGLVTFVTEHVAKFAVDTTGDMFYDLRDYFIQRTGYDFTTIAWILFAIIYLCYKVTDSFVFGALLFALLTMTLFDNYGQLAELGLRNQPRAIGDDDIDE